MLGAGGGLLAAGVAIATLVGSWPAPTQASLAGAVSSSAPAATSASAATATASATADPGTAKAKAFLAALKQAGIPASRSGEDEIKAATVVCRGLLNHGDRAALAKSVSALLPALPARKAPAVVDAAEEHYC